LSSQLDNVKCDEFFFYNLSHETAFFELLAHLLPQKNFFWNSLVLL